MHNKYIVNKKGCLCYHGYRGGRDGICECDNLGIIK